MVKFDRFQLDNGLKVIVHKDVTTPIAAINILYDVGARDEDPNKTGFAHLFEHLMFGGSINIPFYDKPLQRVGGDNNAFTNNDFTNYYLTLPVNNIETGFWLESDRMLELDFSEKSLKVQRKVVVEEFNQRYLNQPYGDVSLLLGPLAYKVHPYQWSTIGKDISHIKNAVLDDVKDFFFRFYRPNNAIMVVSGNVETKDIKKLSEKWFGPIPVGKIMPRNLPKEPEQTKARSLKVEKDVPYDFITKAYHMCSRNDKEYYTTDLLSDILSNGKSARLYQKLVKEKRMFSDINAHISGNIDNGLFIFSGYLIKGVKMEEAEKAIQTEIDIIKDKLVEESELQKVKNKIESTLTFGEMNILDKSMNLAYHELRGDANLINTEVEKYSAVTRQQIKKVAGNIFKETNCSTLYYYSSK